MERGGERRGGGRGKSTFFHAEGLKMKMFELRKINKILR